jgi:4-(gamma-glutamylamino)butanal dehydrogenase
MDFADLIDTETGELARLESLDAGKPITDCRNFDFPDVVHTIRWYAEAADKVFGKVSPTGPDHLGLIVREPIGVVGAVLPRTSRRPCSPGRSPPPWQLAIPSLSSHRNWPR